MKILTIFLLFLSFNAFSQSRDSKIQEQLIAFSVGGAGNGGTDLAMQITRALNREGILKNLDIRGKYKIAIGDYNFCPDVYKFTSHFMELTKEMKCDIPAHFYPRYGILLIDKENWLAQSRNQFLKNLSKLVRMIHGMTMTMDCTKLSSPNEKELLKNLKGEDAFDIIKCQENSNIYKDVNQYRASLYPMVLKMNGLPKRFLKKWRKLTYNQMQIIEVHFKLCLNNDTSKCADSEQLIAKNIKIGKNGYILVNRDQWFNTKTHELRYGILWHEILGILGYEINSYDYSSMVDFTRTCETVSTSPTSGTHSCSVTATLHDPNFLK